MPLRVNPRTLPAVVSTMFFDPDAATTPGPDAGPFACAGGDAAVAGQLAVAAPPASAAAVLIQVRRVEPCVVGLPRVFFIGVLLCRSLSRGKCTWECSGTPATDSAERQKPRSIGPRVLLATEHRQKAA